MLPAAELDPITFFKSFKGDELVVNPEESPALLDDDGITGGIISA